MSPGSIAGRRGRLYVIAAPSGAGKTSLVRALLERVRSGESPNLVGSKAEAAVAVRASPHCGTATNPAAMVPATAPAVLTA